MRTIVSLFAISFPFDCAEQADNAADSTNTHAYERSVQHQIVRSVTNTGVRRKNVVTRTP